MATSTIKDRSTHYKDISVAGTAVTNADAGWYYAEISLSNQLPANTLITGVCTLGSWDASVFYKQYGNTGIIITSPTSRTLGSNRSVRVFYQYL